MFNLPKAKTLKNNIKQIDNNIRLLFIRESKKPKTAVVNNKLLAALIKFALKKILKQEFVWVFYL